MTNDKLLNSLTKTSLFETYLLCGIVGLLIFIACISLIVFLTTSCYCFYSISSYLGFHHCHRYSSYELNENIKKQENIKKSAFTTGYSNDISTFTELYDSYPNLINSKTAFEKEINNKNIDTTYTTINTISSKSPHRPFTQTGTHIVNL